MTIWEYFSILPDPRVERTRLHKLEDIITMALCAVIGGAETWVDIARQIGDQVSTERRYFISSLPGHTAQRLAQAVRNHWCVENELHGSLDVCFGEDQSRARIGNAAENLSRVRRLALMLLKTETTAKVGLKAKRLMAGWDEQYLLRILKI